ncbi:armadillo-type protein [Crucibulum laeve]|uniref:Armadillo-type protein n=1 Tax=Crucibulum laeve TaxID=68775 RepID=A0A5C3LY18_9AGAR|nr:armadillo-type protein [Crucibulum laeve]
MTISPLNTASLKKVKNTVIGNPLAKLQLAQDERFIRTLVECLNAPTSSPDPQSSTTNDDIRIEAAHVISSLSYGSEEALAALLRAGAPQAFLFAISHFNASDSLQLRSAFTRALRAVAASIADIVGPSQCCLKADKSIIRTEAKEALSYLFQIDSLDIYLPLLSSSHSTVSTSIAQLLAASIRSPEDRRAIAEWLPLADRQKEVKTRRGWEKTAAVNANAPSRQGGWVARELAGLLNSRDLKLQEAALSALAALAKDNVGVATALAKPSADRDVPSVLSTVLLLTKTRAIDIQLAGCLCATHIIRASTPSYSSLSEDPSVRSVMNVITRMISTPSEDELGASSISAIGELQNKTKACFILYYLVRDDNRLCTAAAERGCLLKLGNLVQTITPAEPPEDWAEDEAESVSSLREAALTAIAALCLADNDVRRSLTDDLKLLPQISTALSHQHAGTRYAACQCVRALSRAVAVLRTNLLDSGLGMKMFDILKRARVAGEGEEGGEEDRRVLNAALSAVCNVVNEFSPLRQVYLDQGIMPRLVQIMQCGEPSLRLNALWAVKNLIRKSTTEAKRNMMECMGWSRLAELLSDPDIAIQEQAFNIVRNLAEDEDSIDMVFSEIGNEVILDKITMALGSKEDDVVLHATYSLANLANGTDEQQMSILTYPNLLSSLRTCLAESKAEIRRPAVSFIVELARGSPKKRKPLLDAGFVSTLRHLCEWSGAGVTSPVGSPSMAMSTSPGRSPVSRTYGSWGGSGSAGGGGWHGHAHHAAHHNHSHDEKDVVEQARMALDWLEHGDVYASI